MLEKKIFFFLLKCLLLLFKRTALENNSTEQIKSKDNTRSIVVTYSVYLIFPKFISLL